MGYFWFPNIDAFFCHVSEKEGSKINEELRDMLFKYYIY